jgi:hypothetical protein
MNFDLGIDTPALFNIILKDSSGPIAEPFSQEREALSEELDMSRRFQTNVFWTNGQGFLNACTSIVKERQQRTRRLPGLPSNDSVFLSVGKDRDDLADRRSNFACHL